MRLAPLGIVLLAFVPLIKGLDSAKDVDRTVQICYASNLDFMALRFFAPMSIHDRITIKKIDPKDIITLIIGQGVDKERAIMFKENKDDLLENGLPQQKYNSVLELLRRNFQDFRIQSLIIHFFYNYKTGDIGRLEIALDERSTYWRSQKDISKYISSLITGATSEEISFQRGDFIMGKITS